MSDNNAIHKIDEKLPLGRTITLGLQHALALYAGTIAVPLVIGKALGLNPHEVSMLVAAGIFTSGIATLLHNFGIGNFIGIRLPVLMGEAFAIVGACIAIAKTSGITVMYGSIIGMGLIMFLAAPIIGKLARFFPKLVTGSIVTIIGITLLPAALKNIGGGNADDPAFGDPKNLLLAMSVVIVILIANRYFKGYMQTLSVLLGLIFGTVVAGFMGMLDASHIAEAQWIHVVTPFAFGLPKFEIGGILTLGLIGVVELAESLGVFNGVANICDKKIDNKRVVAGLRGEGLANILSGVINAFPLITYSQNIGLLSLTNVYSRYVTITAGFILVALGCIPKFAAIATLIPAAVIGGAMLVMFSMVAISGIGILSEVDLSKTGNMLTASLAIGVGIGVSMMPSIFQHSPQIIVDVFGHSGIVSGAFVAILCNILFNRPDKIEGKIELESKVA